MKVKLDSQLNERQFIINKQMHKIASDEMPKVHDMVATVLNDYCPMNGDEGLGYFMTMLCHFNAAFLLTLKTNLVDRDDTGRDLEELTQGLFEGITAMLQINKVNVPLKHHFNGEIKSIIV